MTVIAMSRAEIDRMSVLRDLAEDRIRVSEAATLMGLGRRQVLRLAKAYRQHGPVALVSRRRGQPSNRSYPAALRTEAIALICERYVDFGPTLAAEKLSELHDLHLGRETIRQWMMAAEIWKDRRQRLKPVHQPRHRRDCVGELIQIDGSDHWWFETRGPRCTLLVYIDDATKRPQVNQAAIVENKRLGPMLAYIAVKQKELDMPRSGKAPRRRGQTNHMFKVG
jgi:hypothetical protein